MSQLTPLDIATGGMLGVEPLERYDVPRHRTMHEAMVAVVGPALATGRCLVSFSGGRDSSWVLASCTGVARELGLPEPVPVTLRFTGAPDAAEHVWQEQVVEHLGLRDWERIQIDDELQLVAPRTQDTLRRHGLLFPANASMMLPALERARGGVVIIGQGGAEFEFFWRWSRLADVMARRERPQLRDLQLLALAAVPPALRRAMARRRAGVVPLPWLRPQAAGEAMRLLAAEVGGGDVRFNAALRSLLTHRCFSGTLHTMRTVAEPTGARVLIPTLEPELFMTLARLGGAWGWGDRSRMLQALAGHLLPPEVVTRPDKGRFNQVFFGEHTRAFGERWSGGGLDEELVDTELLRDMWSGDRRDWRTGLLMQQAWLHDEKRRADAP